MILNILLLIISVIVAIYALGNLFLNSKWYLWELVLLIPTWLLELFIVILIAFSIALGSFPSFILNILSFAALFKYIDFSFGPLLYTPQEDNPKPNIKVFDWNTFYFNPLKENEIAQLINDQDADILLLQELWKPVEPDNFDRKSIFSHNRIKDRYTLEEINEFFPSYKYAINFREVAILSRFPIEKVSEFYCNENFSYVAGKVEISGQDLYLISVHLPHSFGRKDFFFNERMASFSSLQRFLDDLQIQGKRFIISGDFNTTKSWNFIYHLFRNFREAIDEHHLGLPITWRTNLPLWRLDFMFYNQAKNFYCTKSWSMTKKDISDHRALTAEFVIK